jgi:pimeloyl-ACP methyl ester carboxylesterase
MQSSITLDQVSLSYLEFNPQAAQTIFFIHGNSASSLIWMSQLTSPVLANYRLIAFDLPAHGDSGVMNEYSMISLGSIMAKAVEQLHQGKPYILAGLSVGTNVAAEMLLHGAKPEAMVLIGSCIVGGEVGIPDILHKEANLEAGFSDEPTDEALLGYFSKGLYFQKQEVMRELSNEFRKVKDQFRTKLGQSVAAGQFSNEIEALQQYNKPVLLIFGEDDKVIDIHYLDKLPLPLWKNEPYIIPQAGHFPNLEQPEKTNTLIAEFAAGVFK